MPISAAKRLVFGSPQQRSLAEGVDFQQGMAYATEVFSEVIPLLEQTDTQLAIEPLSSRSTNFIRTAAEGAELVRRLDTPRFRMILDCLAMASESIPIPQLIRTHHSLMVHFHANDPNRQGLALDSLTLSRSSRRYTTSSTAIGSRLKSSTFRPVPNGWPGKASTI